MSLRIISSVFLLLIRVMAVELPADLEGKKTEEKEKPITAVQTEVSVLCYHDFSDTLSATEMRIRGEVFAKQMQLLADSKINVISLSDFVLWKSGKKQLPAQNVMITIDDGWKSVYEVAFPILKKHSFPFSLGLYTDFIDNGGKTLEQGMLNEMRRGGMEIACHSATHPFPSKVKKARNAGEEAYQAFLNKEITQSKVDLDALFSIDTPAYIYPGGYYLQDMFPAIREGGMNYAFTVKPGKISLASSNFELPRYVVLGTTSRMFEEALKFSEPSAVAVKTLSYPVKPDQGTSITERLPWVGIDLSSVKDLDRDSVFMRVSGFGKVKADFIKDTARFEWKVNRTLRLPSYEVMVQWRLKGKSKYESPVSWQFFVNHQAEYSRLLKTPPEPTKVEAQ